MSYLFQPCRPLSPLTRGHTGWAGLPGHSSWSFISGVCPDSHVLVRCWGPEVPHTSPQLKGEVCVHVLFIYYLSICLSIYLSINHLSPIYLSISMIYPSLSFLPFSLPSFFLSLNPLCARHRSNHVGCINERHSLKSLLLWSLHAAGGRKTMFSGAAMTSGHRPVWKLPSLGVKYNFTFFGLFFPSVKIFSLPLQTFASTKQKTFLLYM